MTGLDDCFEARSQPCDIRVGLPRGVLSVVAMSRLTRVDET